VANAAAREASVLAGLHPALGLPLAQIGFPALCQRPPPRRDTVMETIFALVHADGRISLSEYCLSRMLYAEMYEATHHEPPWATATQRHTHAARRAAATTLLSTLAQAGHGDTAVAEQAFRAGAAHLLPYEAPRYQPVQDDVAALDTVWPVLDGLGPRVMRLRTIEVGMRACSPQSSGVGAGADPEPRARARSRDLDG
jgi:hypothetical protein